MSSEPRFPFIAGSPSLSFVDTLGGRDGVLVERIGDAESFGAWLRATGLAAGEVRPEAKDAEQARALREAIYRAVRAVTLSRAPEAMDITRINEAALAPPPRPQLTPAGLRLIADSPIAAALSAIAADAIEIQGRSERLRECPECRMLFLDNSRPGRRRWCSSAAGCGNRAKVRNHRARQARQASMGG